MPSQRHFALLSPHETRPHSEVGWAISIGLACVAATALLLLLWVGGQALLLKLDQRERIKAEARAAGLTPAQVAMLDAGRTKEERRQMLRRATIGNGVGGGKDGQSLGALGAHQDRRPPGQVALAIDSMPETPRKSAWSS